ncbi:MAG: DUF5682 family protein [Chloroflexota bacterium]
MSSSNRITVFGIRHHGPGSAHSLRQALEALKPDTVLVEGPPDAEALLPWLDHPDLNPPVALLIYVPDQPRQSAFYPFAVFSPEWQALQYGLRNKIPCRFIDLPQAYQLAAHDTSEEPAPVPDTTIPTLSALDPLTWISESVGYNDPERFWEHLVEQRRDSRDLFAAILELIKTLRVEFEQEIRGVTIPPQQSHTGLELEREAFMRQSIRSALAEGRERIAVVCGAWHAPALVEMPPAKQDAARLKDLTKVKVASAWVPWSYGRLARKSGYGAGIESPGWYDALWQASEKGLSTTELTIRWMTQAAQLLREEDLNASSAHVIEAVRLSETLAALREHSLPGLPELNEAVCSVFCFGDDLPLRLIREKLIIGERLGHVPDEAPATPLQADLAQHQKRLRLPGEANQRDLDLDLRKSNDLERSILLHRLELLNIPWGVHQHVSGKSGTFHEFWRLQWKPELAVLVVEASLWGNTVAEASGAFVQHLADQAADLPALTSLVGRVLLAALPEVVETLMARLDSQAALASDIGQVMDALPALADVLRYGNVRQTDTTMIGQVVDVLVARICVGLPAACASLNDDAANEMFDRLIGSHRAIALLQNPDYLHSWQVTLNKLADQSGLHGLIAGRACAILLDQGIIHPDEAARRLGLALTTANEPAQAAAWVEGFLKDSGAMLIHSDRLWQVLDDWVARLPAEAFTFLLPLIRRTFSTFTAPERRMIGERARKGDQQIGHYGALDTVFDLQRAEAVLPLIAKLLGVSVHTEDSQ